MEACAEQADLSVTFLGEIERGEKEPSLQTLRKLSSALGVRIQDFISGIEQDAIGVTKDELLDRLRPLLVDRYSATEAMAICSFVSCLRPAAPSAAIEQ